MRACDPGTDIFIHGTLIMPFLTIPYDHRRFMVYQMFYHNTPDRVADFFGRIRFRLLLMGTTAIEGRMEIDRFRVTTEYSEPRYRTYWCEQ